MSTIMKVMGAILILATVLVGGAGAQTKLACLELDFEPMEFEDSTISDYSDAVRLAANTVIPTSIVRQITRETIYDRIDGSTIDADCSLTCAVQVGRILQARYVVRGSCRMVEGRVVLGLELYDTVEESLVTIDRATWTRDSASFSEVRGWAEGFFGVFARFGEFGRPMTGADLAQWDGHIDRLMNKEDERASGVRSTGYIVTGILAVPAVVYVVGQVGRGILKGQNETTPEEQAERETKIRDLETFLDDWQTPAISSAVAAGLALWITESHGRTRSREEIEEREHRKRHELARDGGELFLSLDWKADFRVDPLGGAQATLSCNW